jgi:hypothetical protein
MHYMAVPCSEHLELIWSRSGAEQLSCKHIVLLLIAAVGLLEGQSMQRCAAAKDTGLVPGLYQYIFMCDSKNVCQPAFVPPADACVQGPPHGACSCWRC